MKLMLAALLLGGTLFAQTPATGAAQNAWSAVSGTVKDQSGAAIPKASVTLADREHNVAFASRTDNAGRFSFTPLPAGRYSVSAAAPGFRTQSDPVVELTPGQQATVDITMQVGAASFEFQSPRALEVNPLGRPGPPAPSKATKEEMAAKLREVARVWVKNRPCAVPLTGIPPQGSPAPIKTFTPTDPDRLAMKTAPLPAPSCEDVER